MLALEYFLLFLEVDQLLLANFDAFGPQLTVLLKRFSLHFHEFAHAIKGVKDLEDIFRIFANGVLPIQLYFLFNAEDNG